MRCIVLCLVTLLIGMPVLQAAEACCVAMPEAEATSTPVAGAELPPCHATTEQAQSSPDVDLPHDDCGQSAACMSGVLAASLTLLWHMELSIAERPRSAGVRSTLDGVKHDLMRPPSLT